jgi:formamidopyrimidine-DNA glycosylase
MAVTEIERYAKELEKQMAQTGKRMIVKHLVLQGELVMDKRQSLYEVF